MPGGWKTVTLKPKKAKAKKLQSSSDEEFPIDITRRYNETSRHGCLLSGSSIDKNNGSQKTAPNVKKQVKSGISPTSPKSPASDDKGKKRGADAVSQQRRKSAAERMKKLNDPSQWATFEDAVPKETDGIITYFETQRGSEGVLAPKSLPQFLAYASGMMELFLQRTRVSEEIINGSLLSSIPSANRLVSYFETLIGDTDEVVSGTNELAVAKAIASLLILVYGSDGGRAILRGNFPPGEGRGATLLVEIVMHRLCKTAAAYIGIIADVFVDTSKRTDGVTSFYSQEALKNFVRILLAIVSGLSELQEPEMEIALLCAKIFCSGALTALHPAGAASEPVMVLTKQFADALKIVADSKSKTARLQSRVSLRDGYPFVGALIDDRLSAVDSTFPWNELVLQLVIRLSPALARAAVEPLLLRFGNDMKKSVEWAPADLAVAKLFTTCAVTHPGIVTMWRNNSGKHWIASKVLLDLIRRDPQLHSAVVVPAEMADAIEKKAKSMQEALRTSSVNSMPKQYSTLSTTKNEDACVKECTSIFFVVLKIAFVFGIVYLAFKLHNVRSSNTVGSFQLRKK